MGTWEVMENDYKGMEFLQLFAQILNHNLKSITNDFLSVTFLTVTSSSSSFGMRVMNHNWSATEQCLHPQSVAEISCHSVLSGDRIRQCETLSESRHKDTDQCL